MGSASRAASASGRRCEKHGLAAAPDGLCALCRSETQRPSQGFSTRALTGLLVMVVVVSAGAMAYRAARTLTQPVISREQEAEAPALPGATSSEATASPPAEQATEQATEAAVAARQGESIPLAEPVPTAAALAVDAPQALPSSAPAELSASERSRPPPTQAELQAALAATPIVMYGTAWCGVCKRARQFMAESGLRYREIDPDYAPGGWDKVAQLTGRRAVPVIVVDGEVTPAGLSPRRVMDAVARSMERRLGVTGIRFKSG